MLLEGLTNRKPTENKHKPNRKYYDTVKHYFITKVFWLFNLTCKHEHLLNFSFLESDISAFFIEEILDCIQLVRQFDFYYLINVYALFKFISKWDISVFSLLGNHSQCTLEYMGWWGYLGECVWLDNIGIIRVRVKLLNVLVQNFNLVFIIPTWRTTKTTTTNKQELFY